MLRQVPASATYEQRTSELRAAFQAAIEAGEPAYKIKRLIDDAQHWACMEKIGDEWAGFSDGEMARGLLDLEISALRLNDLVLAGWPGESMIDTCLWLRAQSIGDRLVVVDQINGYPPT